MLYLAILLILCGLLILITALSIETGKVSFDGDMKTGVIKNSSGTCSDKSSFADFDSEEVEIIFPGDRIDNEDVFVDFDTEPADLYMSEKTAKEDDWELKRA